MPFKLVTCPETAHLELISYEDHPLGTLVEECSRFQEPCIPDCPRTCAERLDRRARVQREIDPAVCDVLQIGDDTNVGVVVTPMDQRLQTSEP